MFLKNPKLLFKSSSFKLITWYTAFFILSSLVINIYIYIVISSFIYEQSRKEVNEDLLELAELYEEGGIPYLHEDIFEDEEEPFLYRLVDARGNVPLIRTPEEWSDAHTEHLKTAVLNRSEWTYIDGVKGEPTFELKSFGLSDGSMIQMAQVTELRDNLLKKIRKIYLISLIPIILLGYVGGVFLTDRALSPVKQLINTLRSIIDSARIDQRVPAQQSDRMYEELISLFNKMLGKIESLIKGMKDILDNVAHDLRTPMTRLRGTAELALQPGRSAEEIHEALSDCVEESERILITLNTLMDVSEAETGTLKLNPVNFNIVPLVGDIVELYSYVAEDKGVTINVNMPDELNLTADMNWLRQVLANLLDNAIKYTPGGGEVDIEVLRENNHALIKVKDTGIGIPAEELQNIWERLYRGDKSRTQRGLGLGLSLVRAIVRAHKGQVEVTSQPGVGSIFSIYLPA